MIVGRDHSLRARQLPGPAPAGKRTCTPAGPDVSRLTWSSAETWQDRGVLDSNRLQFARVQSEQVEYGRRDLRGLHRSADDPPAAQAREHDQDRDVPVLTVGPAVLGNLSLPAGVYHAVLNDPEDVWMPGIADRHAEGGVGRGTGVDGLQAGGRNRGRGAAYVVASCQMRKEVELREAGG